MSTSETELKDENTAENTIPNNQEEALPTTPADKVAELEAKVAELNDRYLRLYSEFDNYRKRTTKEKIEYMKTAGEDVFKALLPVVDDFERAIKFNETMEDLAPVKEGFSLIYNKISSTLTNKGLEAVESKGLEFNPDIHEAITNVPAPSDDLKGKIIDELEKGYTLNGKVIRFAKVVVGN